MNQKLLLIAMIIISGFISAAFADAGNVKVYGKANVSLNQNDFEDASGGIVMQDQDNWTVNSNASRLGVKGSVAINDTLKAIYKMEYEIFVDDGSDGSDEFSQRNIYGGLQGKFGTIIAGKHDTPLKMAQRKVDRFNDLDRGDIKYVMIGENRMSNIVMYTAPKMHGFSVSAALMPGENNEDDGLADHISLAGTYTGDNFYLAIAIDDDVKSTDAVRLVGEYHHNNIKVGALYQMAEQHQSMDSIGSLKAPLSSISANYKEQDAFLLSGEWKLNTIVLKGQFAFSESTPRGASSLDDTETTQIAFGADYILNKSTKLFAYFSQIEAEADSSFTNGDVTDSTIGAGLEIKF